MNKRVVILWLCFFVCRVAGRTNGIESQLISAFKKGNSQELNGYLSDKVELILESRSINVDNQAAEKKMASFFSGNRVSGFTVNHQGKRNESSFIVGTLTTANGNFRVNCFFRKVAGKYVIHQIRIDKTNE